MSERGSITDEELERMLGNVFAVRSGQSREQPDGTFQSSSEPDLTQTDTIARNRKRRYAGRGSYGWVTSKNAEDLVLVSLFELGGTAKRGQILESIEGRWGNFFVDEDYEILPVARETRWSKTCQWAVWNLKREGYIQRPRRGIQELTESGRSQAEIRRKAFDEK